MPFITTIQQLESIYGSPGETSMVKEVNQLTANYRALIEASPFAVLATAGPGGLDCSPRGDRRGFVRIADDKTLLLPDRRGNNRVDSLRNIVVDPRVALLFLIPGSGTTLRVNGKAKISVDAALCESFKIEDKSPRSVVVVMIDSVYFQCSRAIVRSEIWDPKTFVDPQNLPPSLPTPGKILADLTSNRLGGDEYDRKWPERAGKSLW